MKDKSKGRYLPKRHADASRPAADMSQWDLMLAIYPYDKRALAAGLAGQRSVPLEGLLLGCPPAQGSLLVDWSLFASELEQDFGPLVEPAIAAGLFSDVGSLMSVVGLSALQHAVGRDVVGPLDDRVDYWRALLGDAYSARELRDRNRGRNHLVSAALDGLVSYCQTGRRADKGVWRPGLGMEVFLSSIWSAQHDLDEASKAAGLVVDWSAHHRERDHKAGVEVGLQAADDRAHNAVEDAAEWLSDRRSPIEKAQAEQAAKRRAEAEAKAGAVQVETAFAAWRRMRAVGQEVPEDLQRKAADEVLIAAERLEDRPIPVDVDDPEQARRILEQAAALEDDVEQSIEEDRDAREYAAAAMHDSEMLLALAGNRIEEGRRNRIMAAGGPPLANALLVACNISDADFEALLKRIAGSAAEPVRTAADEARFRRAAGDQSHVDASLAGMGDEEIERLAAEASGAHALRKSLAAKEAANARTIKVLGPVKSKANGMGDNDLAKLFEGVADTALPLRVADEVAMSREDLVREWPHALDVIDRILADVREGEVVRLRPTLLVGGPGTGKTTLAKAVTALLGLPTVVFPCASVADGSFGGTPAQWASRRPSVPLEAIRQHEVANPAVVLDEIEKTGQNDRNGNLLHALLPMLEAHSAKSYFEVGLEQNVDLSAVVFLATANSLEGVPQPLLDRFRVLRMPDPGPQHIGDLARTIVADIVGDRRLDRRWVPDLAPDELDVVRKAWGGGSLRRLRRAVEATLEAREMHLRGRAM